MKTLSDSGPACDLRKVRDHSSTDTLTASGLFDLGGKKLLHLLLGICVQVLLLRVQSHSACLVRFVSSDNLAPLGGCEHSGHKEEKKMRNIGSLENEYRIFICL